MNRGAGPPVANHPRKATCLSRNVDEIKRSEIDGTKQLMKADAPDGVALLSAGRSQMKKLFATIAVIAFTVSLGTGAVAQEKAVQGAKKTVYRERTGTVTVTVQSIDLANRIVTVWGGPRGQVVQVKVDDKVKNLSRLKVGDEVTIKYVASVAVRVTKPVEIQGKETMEKAKKEGPGTEKRTITVTATVQEIDRDRNNVFLKWPEGAVVGMQVKDPGILEGVKEGDRVVITYIEALAISIEKKNR